jgi:hypothetical protein
MGRPLARRHTPKPVAAPAADGAGSRGVTVPAAEGIRVAWEELPEAVRAAIEKVCGAPVEAASTQPGGFSPGAAARLRCADGTRWFVKPNLRWLG